MAKSFCQVEETLTAEASKEGIFDDEFNQDLIECGLGIQQDDKQRLLGRVQGMLD